MRMIPIVTLTVGGLLALYLLLIALVPEWRTDWKTSNEKCRYLGRWDRNWTALLALRARPSLRLSSPVAMTVKGGF